MKTRRDRSMARASSLALLVVVGLALGWAGAVVAADAAGGLPVCREDLNMCTTQLTAAQADLNTCTTQLTAAQKFPATGQTTCWDSSGTVITCTGTGQDGDIQAGATLSYTDNGDGTITDNNTKLMWEKKSADGSIHDKDTTYTWANAFAVHVAGLNAANFAGYTDWRLPNVKELQSIINYGESSPAVSADFNTGCVASCSLTTCSCTASGIYWSSSTSASFPSLAWQVFFSDGTVLEFNALNNKSSSFSVRAVRGGL